MITALLALVLIWTATAIFLVALWNLAKVRSRHG